LTEKACQHPQKLITSVAGPVEVIDTTAALLPVMSTKRETCDRIRSIQRSTVSRAFNALPDLRRVTDQSRCAAHQDNWSMPKLLKAA
jgi:hypothetical protein